MQTWGITALESTDEQGRVCLAYAQQPKQSINCIMGRLNNRPREVGSSVSPVSTTHCLTLTLPLYGRGWLPLHSRLGLDSAHGMTQRMEKH